MRKYFNSTISIVLWFTLLLPLVIHGEAIQKDERQKNNDRVYLYTASPTPYVRVMDSEKEKTKEEKLLRLRQHKEVLLQQVAALKKPIIVGDVNIQANTSSLNRKANSSGNCIFLGTCTNTGSTSAVFVKITASFYNASGTLLGSDFSYVAGGTNSKITDSEIYINALGAGQTGFFEVSTFIPNSQVSRVEYKFSYSMYDHTAAGASIVFPSTPIFSNSYGNTKVIGEMRNTSTRWITYFTKVYFALLDSAGKVQDMDFAYVDGSVYNYGSGTTDTALQPLETGTYSNSFYNTPYVNYATYLSSFEWDEVSDNSGISTPTVTTTVVSSVTQSSALCGGNITSDGGSTVTARGVCWSTTTNPTLINSKTTDGTGTGSFTSTITGLTANTPYYARAYATNSIGTAYGSNQNFTTAIGSILPEIDPPFGSYATPDDGITVSGSIAVTGWALDDSGVASVKIYRAQGSGLVYIGDALFVEGARPDVAAAYPEYPSNTKAGWGYMLLTNFLPDGQITLTAIATDLVGKTTELGSRTITIDNAHAIKPFGAIDTPTQGGTATGKSFLNWGWALTPQPNSIPTNGSTLNVWVNGVNKGHPTYNLYRSDIATLFPGYANSNGAIGYLYLDTTKYSNGVHTIQWTATDNAGNTDGIGSRYFTIQNTSSDSAQRVSTRPMNMSLQQISMLPEDSSEPLYFSKGFNRDNDCLELLPDEKGNNPLTIKELERVEIQLGQNYADIQGYLINGSQLSKLPIGSTLDTKQGIFAWSPGPGFLGSYSLVFVLTDANGQSFKKSVEIKIEPKFNN